MQEGPKSASREVENLARQKQNLVAEIRRLEAQIARIDEESQRPIRAAVNPALLSQMDRDYRSLKENISRQRSELEKIRSSDAAAHRSELQEEAKVVFQELLRLQDVEKSQKEELADITAEHEDLDRQEGPVAAQRQRERIAALNTKLEKYRQANHKLAARIKTGRANKAFDNDDGRARIEKRMQELGQSIEEEKNNVKLLIDRIDETRRRHRQELRLLRARK